MKRTHILTIMLVVLIQFAFAQKPAIVAGNEPGWRKIGETTASFAKENESIVVLGADKFEAIRLRVTDAPINIERLQVVYESGDVQEVNVQNKLEAGQETRVINLERNEEIEKVAFTYQTAENYRGEKAHVEVHGLKPEKQKSDSYKNDNNNDLEETERDIENATDEARRDADETGDDVERATENTESDLERGAEKTGDKISEAAGNTAASVEDQVYRDKVGPNGEKVYIDNHSKYYYINDEGKRIYVSKSQLKNKPKKEKDDN